MDDAQNLKLALQARMDYINYPSEVPNTNTNICVLINEIPTEIVITNFEDKLFIMVTQFKKSGTLVLVKKETFQPLEDHEEVYKLSLLLGCEDNNTLTFVRTIAEFIKIPKTTLFSIGMKDFSLQTLKAVVSTINKIKTW